MSLQRGAKIVSSHFEENGSKIPFRRRVPLQRRVLTVAAMFRQAGPAAHRRAGPPEFSRLLNPIGEELQSELSDGGKMENSRSDFRQRVVLGKTGLLVSRLGLASSYGLDADGVEEAYQQKGINYLYWGSMRRVGDHLHHGR
jgi:hypothetical protein